MKALKQALARDTLVLHSFNIFDYSLILAVKKPENQAIIDRKCQIYLATSLGISGHRELTIKRN